VDGRFAPSAPPKADARPSSKPVRTPGGQEAILVVEDQSQVRESTRTILERLGYRVRTAVSADEALRYVREGGEIDLLLTDVVLPGMNGVALAERVAGERAGIHVLFMSGYTSAACVPEGALRGVPCGFLQKPFNLEALARAVRAILDRSS
jgi:two-component system cell cycle sensor histidine kinase/response regulator CckA